VVFAVGIVGAAGCTPSKPAGTGAATGEQAVKGGSINVYIGTPAYIDPYNTQESEGTKVESLVFDSLTQVDAFDSKKVLPAAALSWEPNADATVWTFKLNPADKFSDGSPVTAKDFVYAWNRIVNPNTKNTATGKVDPSTINYHLSNVQGYDAVSSSKATTMTGVVAVDDLTLKVTLSKPFGDFDYVVSHPALAPVPEKYVTAGVDFNGKKVAYNDMPIGNGPFKLSEPWKQGQYIKVVRSDNYYGTKPLLDGVNFKIFKDPDTAYTEFEAGTMDFTQIGQGQIKAAIAKYGQSPDGYTVNPGKQALLGPEVATYYLVCNNKDKYLGNADVRKAFSYAINREAIVQAIFEGTRAPADNVVPPPIAGYQAGTWKDSKYDVAAAQAALTAAGYPGGKGLPTIKLSFNTGGGHEKIMQLIQADLAKIGVKTTFDSADFPTYLKELQGNNWQIGRLGWIADYPIMDNFLFPLFTQGSTDNYSKYDDPAVTKGLNDARAITDSAARIAAYQKQNETVQATNPIIPIMFYKHHDIGSSRVHDLVYDAQGILHLEKTWVTGGAAAK
jgi:peptide/nickel transport system substrate-binding protein/oligopeptide transport system substrate-binding protein